MKTYLHGVHCGSMITHVRAIPSAFGGLVQLNVQATSDPQMRIFRTTTPAPPAMMGPGHKVFEGKAKETAFDVLAQTEVYTILDLDFLNLPDGEKVYYHIFDLSAPAMPAKTVSCTPGCAMSTSMKLLKDIVKPRIVYHLRRGLRQQLFTLSEDTTDIPVLAGSGFYQGIPLPALTLRETVTANPSGETIGLNGPKLESGGTLRHSSRGRVDLMLYTLNPEEQATLAPFIHSMLLQDRNLFHQLGLIGMTINRFDREIPVENESQLLHTSEWNLECIIYTVTETVDPWVLFPEDPDDPDNPDGPDVSGMCG